MSITTEPRFRGDSGFGTFLDYMQSRGIGVRSPAATAAAFAAGSAAASAVGDDKVAAILALMTAAAAAEAAMDQNDGGFGQGDLPTQVLAALARNGPRDIAALLTDTGTPPLASLLATLNTLQRFGLVVRGPPSDQESFDLSAVGGRTARVLSAATGDK